MLQSPNRAARMAAAILLFLTFLLSTSLPASAASCPASTPSTEPISKPVKVFDAAPILQAKTGTITCTVDFYWDGSYHPVLTDDPAGAGSLFFYDTLKVTVGGQQLVAPSRGCDTPDLIYGRSIQPLDINGYLTLGFNHVTIDIENICGKSGNSDIFLTTYGMKVPYTPPVTTPQPPAPSPSPAPSHVYAPPAASPPPASPPARISPPVPPKTLHPAPARSAVPSAPHHVPAPAQPPVAAPVPVPPVLTPNIPAPAQPEVKPSAACGWDKFFGVRGSGEKSSDFFGFGEPVGMMQGVLQVNLPGLKAEPIDYLAIPVDPMSFTYTSDYVNSVDGGVQALYRDLHKFIQDCPHTYAILAGYSQGAEVVGIVYSRLKDEERRHVASVTLFGDPRFNPAQTLVNKGDFSPKFEGIDISLLADLRVQVPAGWDARVQSYCTQGDPICNYSPGNLPACNPFFGFVTCPHGKYYDRGWTDAAAAWVIKNLGTMPNL